MFRNVTPESVGIKSKQVEKFLKKLNDLGLNMHDVLIMRGEDIFCESYWKPFNKDFQHREYSQTKSYVGIAIGLLIEDGKLKITDRVADYFPDKIDGELPQFLKEQTVEDMLTMRTSVNAENWFISPDRDRVHAYFNRGNVVRKAGTTWQYDSAGSQVLCALVERLAGMPLLDYMKEKIFNKMGTFKNAQILKTPSGESWGDSALLCSPRDMLSFARFVLNYGTFNGERLMNEEYLRKATSKVVDNPENGHGFVYHTGYGYQIWTMKQEDFAFVGMGQQLTICTPKKDLILVCNSDNQGGNYNYGTFINYYYDYIVDQIDKPLEENNKDFESLSSYIDGLELRHVTGGEHTSVQDAINGKKFICDTQNPQGITEFTVTFDGKGFGEFIYVNAQGEKKLKFGLNKNVFQKFPQLGYSNEVGGEKTTDGFTYDCAVSGAWKGDNQLLIFTQIIDKYFGNFSTTLAFRDEFACVRMTKTAEDFLKEYTGEFSAKMQ